jgi:hypothetical protein
MGNHGQDARFTTLLDVKQPSLAEVFWGYDSNRKFGSWGEAWGITGRMPDSQHYSM